jgi:hypothetical protein
MVTPDETPSSSRKTRPARAIPEFTP